MSRITLEPGGTNPPSDLQKENIRRSLGIPGRITGRADLVEGQLVDLDVPDGSDYTLFMYTTVALNGVKIDFPSATFDGQMLVLRNSSTHNIGLQLYRNGYPGYGYSQAIAYPGETYAYQYSTVQNAWLEL